MSEMTQVALERLCKAMTVNPECHDLVSIALSAATRIERLETEKIPQLNISLAKASLRIAELESARRWVPVSEGTKGLEILEDYLTTDESGEISKMKYCGVLRGVQKWLWSDNAFYHPTHWMPLPKSPEVQE